jgi:spore maturation protein CgeB
LKLLIVGNPLEFHVGAHLQSAATSLGWEADVENSTQAWSKNKWQNRIHYHLLGNRPPNFSKFNRLVLDKVKAYQPDLLISTGISPLSANSLKAIGDLNIPTVNFLTDDPWNSRNGASYFWDSLVEYNLIANPRYSNLEQLKSLGCKKVEYIPFGYNPNYHFIEPECGNEDLDRFSCDVAILGGADEDRIPLARALAGSGLELALYGSYWDRYPDLKPFYRGNVYGKDLRLAVKLARCQVCMVRRRNRDGHAMRSLEFPAMGACLAVENTLEHRALYGPDGENVVYWNEGNELVQVARDLLKEPEKSDLLRHKLNQHMTTENSHRYADRLIQIKEIVKLIDPLVASC